MTVVKAVAHRLLDDYEVYRILQLTPEDIKAGPPVGLDGMRIRPLRDPAELSASAYPEIRALARYAGSDSKCFVCERGNDIAAASWFWYGDTYLRRNFWPLTYGEAKLIQITTAVQFRNRCIATTLIRYACDEMFKAGFTRLYARVWHSHRASLNVFAKVGWREVALVITMQAFGKSLRLCKLRSGGIRVRLSRPQVRSSAPQP